MWEIMCCLNVMRFVFKLLQFMLGQVGDQSLCAKGAARTVNLLMCNPKVGSGVQGLQPYTLNLLSGPGVGPHSPGVIPFDLS